MPTVDRTKPQEGGGSSGEVLEDGIYYAEIIEVSYRPRVGQYAKEGDMEYNIKWAEKDSGKWLWTNYNPYYGTTSRGPSKWKEFIDSLFDQGLLVNDQFDPTVELVGIEQRVMVEKYIAKSGKNAGNETNKIVKVKPLDPDRLAAVLDAKGDDEPF